VESTEALWTFDVNTHTWQQQQPSGVLPLPSLAVGLALINDHAYLLVNDVTMARRMEVFELDLETWHWRLLPSQGQAPPCLIWLQPVVVQVCPL